MKRLRFLLTILICTSILAGCATTKRTPTALELNPPSSILVIPPRNNSVELNAPYTLISSISRPLAEKGYYVFPVAVVDTLFKENGLPTTAEMNNIPIDKIKEIINPDAILYIDINNWGQEYQIISSRTIVSSSWKLIDASNGQILWKGQAQAMRSSGKGNRELKDALIGALIEQIAGSITDQTYELSKSASESLINSRYRGLPPGPYVPKPKEK